MILVKSWDNELHVNALLESSEESTRIWLCWLWISHTYNNKFLASPAHMLEQCVAIFLTVGDISFAVSKIHTEAVYPMKKLTSWVPMFAISHHLCLHPKSTHWIPTVCSALGDTKQVWSSYCSLKEKTHVLRKLYYPVMLLTRTIAINMCLRTYSVLGTVVKYFACNISSNPHSSSVIISIL